MVERGRVLLIVHDNYQEDNVFPLGPGYFAATLRMAGAVVSVYCMYVVSWHIEFKRRRGVFYNSFINDVF